MNQIHILMPAYKPAQTMLVLISELVKKGCNVTVVDDGSGDAFAALFAQAESVGATVLHHEKNRGKGAALKTGFTYLAEQGCIGAVTADADGQHSCADICRVKDALQQNPTHLILGVRDLSKMPLRSKFGNTLTRFLFLVLYCLRITDTQTGLRGIPLGAVTQKLTSLAGERYEYETNQLIFAKSIFEGITEVPIETIYEKGNASSHFRPLQDGMRIYALLFRHFPLFLLSSLAAFGVDYLLFNLLFYLCHFGTIGSTVAARIVSAAANYCTNKNLVFRKSGMKYTFLRYFALAAFILTLNCLAMYLLVNILHLPAFAAKFLVEAILYFLSFTLQNNFAYKQ